MNSKAKAPENALTGKAVEGGHIKPAVKQDTFLSCPSAAEDESHLNKQIKDFQKQTGNRPHKCHQCSYSAKIKTYLDKHIMAKHTGERPHKCHLCSYSAVQRQLLNRHIMVKHTNERQSKLLRSIPLLNQFYHHILSFKKTNEFNNSNIHFYI